MRFAPATLLLIAAPLGARELIGVHGGWGAFRDTGHCYAIAEPAIAGGRRSWRPFVGVGTRPAQGRRNSLHIRLSRPRDRSAEVALSIGERRFPLIANGTDAWAPDATAERAAVAAMRSGRSMSVDAVGVGGRPFADLYRLDGAATAIDAAALACLVG
ncbi:hypothetical protein [uncultured Sphingomonas sp.]|uniref:hypothetical protein n=1 Tax=uncultured Sphingomonas sp. TaxID=158754 RepID=UPI0035C987E5